MYELSLLKEFITNKDSYINYRNYLRKEDVLDDLEPIFDAVDLWYKNNTDTPAVEDIANLVFSRPVKDGQRDLLKSALTRLDTINGTHTIHGLMESFKTNRTLLDLSSIAYDAQRGYKSVSEVISVAKRLEEPVQVRVDYVTDDIEQILNNIVRTPGLRWRLSCLNRSLGSLRKGDFGFVFARPETGKTTFLASEVTHMATQLTSEAGPILWFNNEEQGEKVKQRCYQAALGMTKETLLGTDPEILRTEYAKATSGKIKIVDDKVTNRRQVEAICHKERPSLILFDQIDKVEGFVSDREDLRMGTIYQWARSLSKEYAPIIGVCQADGTADGEAWLYMGHVANAKTAKQAEADFILGIGKKHDQGYEYIRYINISKNKLTGDSDTNPNYRHARLEVLIRPEIARYEDIE